MAERFRKRRQALRLNQLELAEVTGLRHGTISGLESGKQPGMSVETARKIACAFGVSIDDLVDTWDEETKLAPTLAL